MVHILASGVFFSGFLKDLLCVPRPLSPPLHRITMSGSAALEYGFPSTHSTNAVSVAAYAVLALHEPSNPLSSTTKTCLEALAYFYAVSIVVGRLYCGMHGFIDVIAGSALGLVLSLMQYAFVDPFDAFIQNGQIRAICIFVLFVLVLVRIHPEPADDCPCFDDSVAFAGVVLGVEIANWHFATTRFSVSDPVPSTVPFDFYALGVPTVIVRTVLGVSVIIVWRITMKSLLLKALPPLFRIGENLGLILPRKFFKQASYAVFYTLTTLMTLTFCHSANTIKSPNPSKQTMSCPPSRRCRNSYLQCGTEHGLFPWARSLQQTPTKLSRSGRSGVEKAARRASSSATQN